LLRDGVDVPGVPTLLAGAAVPDVAAMGVPVPELLPEGEV